MHEQAIIDKGADLVELGVVAVCHSDPGAGAERSSRLSRPWCALPALTSESALCAELSVIRPGAIV